MLTAQSPQTVLIAKSAEDLKKNGHEMFTKERLWETVLQLVEKNDRIYKIVDRGRGQDQNFAIQQIKKILEEPCS